mmetsp:Transcript_4791/g.7601  ORF Transcript_4791/g.7601 Transcript_4791/m.7601 type:complete len:224 (-) Transcript_4791:1250-1921(-)
MLTSEIVLDLNLLGIPPIDDTRCPSTWSSLPRLGVSGLGISRGARSGTSLSSPSKCGGVSMRGPSLDCSGNLGNIVRTDGDLAWVLAIEAASPTELPCDFESSLSSFSSGLSASRLSRFRSDPISTERFPLSAAPSIAFRWTFCSRAKRCLSHIEQMPQRINWTTIMTRSTHIVSWMISSFLAILRVNLRLRPGDTSSASRNSDITTAATAQQARQSDTIPCS